MVSFCRFQGPPPVVVPVQFAATTSALRPGSAQVPLDPDEKILSSS